MLNRKRDDDEVRGMGDDILSSGLKMIGVMLTALFSALAWAVGFVSALIDEFRKK